MASEELGRRRTAVREVSDKDDDPSALGLFVLRFGGVDFHRSAGRHGITNAAIRHAVERALVEYEIDEDPSKVLIIGPDESGNLLEVVVLLLDQDRLLVIHAMSLRSQYHHLLLEGDPDG